MIYIIWNTIIFQVMFLASGAFTKNERLLHNPLKFGVNQPIRETDSLESENTTDQDDPSLTFPYNPNLFEGDILLSGFMKNRRIGIPILKYFQHSMKWPDGVIPYYIDKTFSWEDRLLIARAITEIESISCVRFIPRKNQNDYVYISNSGSCASAVGRKGGIQTLSLGKECLYFGIVLHELLHLLGFWHEHSRSDRNKYVNIHWENIQPGRYSNFLVNHNYFLRDVKLPYDYESILHYAPYTFSRSSSKPSITPKKKGIKIGQRKGLSELNIKSINKLYKCPKEIWRRGHSSSRSLLSTEPRICIDTSWGCGMRQKMGLCILQHKTMMRVCRRSCGLC